jgi:hypothetical protein
MPVVYYTINNSALHLHLGLLSVQSLRRQNRSIPVEIFFYGSVPLTVRKKFERLGAKINTRPSLKDTKDCRHLVPFFQKWEALRHLTSERALFVDADTWFCQDPLKMFDRYQQRDFYAREEYGTRPDIGYQLLGNMVMEPQLHPKKMKSISVMLEFKTQPIFNTGVMLFNHGFGQKVGAWVPEMNRLAKLFAKKPAYFPAQNWHLIEEVTASITFGKLPKFSYGKIKKEDSPCIANGKRALFVTQV